MMKNLLLLISGTTVAQAIPVLFSPLLTRLYSPADFGVLALFTAFATVVGGIANGRYDGAILLPDREEDALQIGAVGACFAVGTSLVFLLLTHLFHESIAALLEQEELSLWLYFFPLSSLLIAVSSLLYQLNLREKNYANLSRSTIARAVTQTAVPLGIGTLKSGELGLIAGQVLSHAAAVVVLVGRRKEKHIRLSEIRLSEMRRLARRYADFPRFSIWATLANTLSYNLINVILSILYGTASAGLYSIVNRVLGMPMTVVGEAFGQVFQREVRDESRNGKRVVAILTGTLLKLAAVSFPVFTVLYLWSEDVFQLVFGEEWAAAGVYARLLIPLFLVRFLSVPLMSILTLYEKQRLLLLWQTGLLACVLAAGAAAKAFALAIESYFLLMSSLLMLHYLVLIVVIYRVSLEVAKEDGMKGKHCCLVMGGYVNGYSIIRELHEQGVRDIILFDTDKNLAAYSNRIRRFVQIEASAPSLRQALARLHEEYERIVVYPTSEKHLLLLHQLREEIAGYCFLPFNPHNLLESISKINQYAHCEKAGVPVPKSVRLLQPSDLSRVQEVPFPLIVRPSHPPQGDSFHHLVVRSRESFVQYEPLLESLLARGVALLASEVIPGDSSNIYAYVGYRDRNGRILNEWIGKKLSQYPDRYGVFASASNQAPAEVLMQGRKLLEAMNLHGIAEAEFKQDPRDGRYKLIEINLRSTMWNRVGFLSGVHILYTQYLDAIGDHTEKEEQVRTKEIHFVYGKHELLGLLRGTIPFRTFWNNLFRSDQTCFAVFDPADLKPFWFDTLGMVRQLARKAANRRKRVGGVKHEKHTHLGSSAGN